ncbi:MAG: glycosyltransferase family 4 protein [Elusimicrobiota bacterium]
MRLCLVNSEHPSKTKPGGIATYVMLIANAMSEAGHAVHVLLKNEMPETGFYKKVVIHRVVRHPLPWKITRKFLYKFFYTGNLFLEYAYGVFKKIEEIRKSNGLDIVEVPDYNGEGFFVARYNNLPLCIKLHTPNALVRHLNGIHSRTISDRILDYIEKYSILNAEGITSPSMDLCLRLVSEFKIKRRADKIIPYPMILPERVNPVRESCDPFVILCVGRLEKRKGFTRLIEILPIIVKTISNVKIQFTGGDTPTGPGETSYRLYMERHAADLGVSDKLEFMQSLERQRLGELYERCDVFVIPSLYDNFPNALLEAMAYGCPVVGTDTGGIHEIIQHGENGLVFKPENNEDLADKIINLYKDRTLAKNLGHRARETIYRKYKPEKIVNDTIGFYKQILKMETDS